MKRNVFRLLTACFSIFVVAVFVDSVLSQGNGGGKPPPPPATNVRYRVHVITGPAEALEIYTNRVAVKTDANGVPLSALVTGTYARTDRPSITGSGFVFDVLGTIDTDSTYADPDPLQPSPPQPYRFWDIVELVGPGPPAGVPEPWASTSLPFYLGGSNGVTALNSSGLLGGSVRDPDGKQHGVYLDLTDLVLQLVLIPPPTVPFTMYSGSNEVTEAGDIVVRYLTPTSGSAYGGYIYNPVLDTQIPITTTNDSPVLFLYDFFRMNVLHQVVGMRAPNEQRVIIRHSNATGISEVFPTLYETSRINDFSQFAGTYTGGTGKNKGGYVSRIGSNGAFEWTTRADRSVGPCINDSGHVVFHNQYGYATYFNDDLAQTFRIVDLILVDDPQNPIDPGRLFLDAGQIVVADLSAADDTGFGWMVGRMRVPIDGVYQWLPFLLIPEELP